MEKCPFCLQEKQRLLGAIFLATAKEWQKGEVTAAEKACNSCLALVAQLLDTWREGGINSFVARARSAGILREEIEYVETGTRRFN